MKQTSDTSFEPDWLGLREPADHAARDKGLLAQAAACVGDGGTVLDLGCGTGSTARAFAAAGFGNFKWRFFDHDPALLTIAEMQTPKAECIVGDIAQIDSLPLDGVSLITASALFDLMSEDWVAALVTRAEQAHIPIYAALNYTGEMHWTPLDARDQKITDAFNAHQRKDKGTGPALGPASGKTFQQITAARGWAASVADSPWQLDRKDALLHENLVTGIAEAANESGARMALAWGADRRAKALTSYAEIGHLDVLAIPERKPPTPRENRSKSHALS